MATLGGAQLQRQRVVQEELTATKSTILVKNLVRTAISSIAYLRNLFPTDCFQEKSLKDLTIRTLLPTCPESELLINWIEQGVFDALDKHYLSDFVFAVYAKGDDKDTLLECYQFHITYPDDENSDGLGGGPVMSTMTHTTDNGTNTTNFTSKDEVRDSSVRLIRTLVTLVQTLKSLPERRFITIKLQYREGVTPSDYEPQYFRAGDDADALVFEQRPYKARVGEVRTKYHAVTVKMKSIADSFVAGVVAPQHASNTRADTGAGAAMSDDICVAAETAPILPGHDFRSPSDMSQASVVSRGAASSPLFRRGEEDDDNFSLGGPLSGRQDQQIPMLSSGGSRSTHSTTGGAGGHSSSLSGFVRAPRAGAHHHHHGQRTGAGAGGNHQQQPTASRTGERLASDLQSSLSLRSGQRKRAFPLLSAGKGDGEDAQPGQMYLTLDDSATSPRTTHTATRMTSTTEVPSPSRSVATAASAPSTTVTTLTSNETALYDEFSDYVLTSGETNVSTLAKRFGRARRGDAKFGAAVVRRFLSTMAARGLLNEHKHGSSGGSTVPRGGVSAKDGHSPASTVYDPLQAHADAHSHRGSPHRSVFDFDGPSVRSRSSSPLSVTSSVPSLSGNGTRTTIAATVSSMRPSSTSESTSVLLGSANDARRHKVIVASTSTSSTARKRVAPSAAASTTTAATATGEAKRSRKSSSTVSPPTSSTGGGVRSVLLAGLGAAPAVARPRSMLMATASKHSSLLPPVGGGSVGAWDENEAPNTARAPLGDVYGFSMRH